MLAEKSMDSVTFRTPKAVQIQIHCPVSPSVKLWHDIIPIPDYYKVSQCPIKTSISS